MTPTRISLPFTATEKQKPFVESSAMFKLGGGARGGGKSHCLAGIAILLSFLFPGNVGYAGRLDLLDFKKTTLPLLLALIPKELLVTHQRQEHYIDILSSDGITTSRIWYGEMKDPDSLLSGNIGWFFIDEAFEVPRETFINLAGSLRGNLPSGKPRPLYGLLASNPAPGWVADTFPVLLDEQELYTEAIAREGAAFTPFPSPYSDNPDSPKMIDPDYAYFPFLARDNQFNGPGYEERLVKQYSKLGPDWVARMVEGVWDASMEGLVYQLREDNLWRGESLYRPGVPVELTVDPSNGAGIYAALVLQRWMGKVHIIDEFHHTGGTDEDFRKWLDSRPYAKSIEGGIADPAKPDSIRRLRWWGYPIRGLTRRKNVTDQINALKLAMSRNDRLGGPMLLIDVGRCPHLISEFRRRVYRKPRIQGGHASEQPVKAHDHLLNALEYWFYQYLPFNEEIELPESPVYKARAYMSLV